MEVIGKVHDSYELDSMQKNSTAKPEGIFIKIPKMSNATILITNQKVISLNPEFVNIRLSSTKSV